MKAAAAVLGASLLFFLGVVTGVGRREFVPPPAAIPLGVVNSTPSADASAPSSSPPGPRRTGKPATPAKSTPAAPPAPSPPSNPSAPPGSPAPAQPAGSADPSGSSTETTATTAPATPSTTTTPSTSPPGQVQQVDNQVDCGSAPKHGKGHRAPCPSTTASTGNGSVGGGQH